MENTKNKETIHFLYDSILNKKQFDKLSEIISPDYTNPSGENGIDGFQKSILGLARAFSDAQWKVEEIIAEGDKVVVKQTFTGIHKNQFQNIQPTDKAVSVDGIATYEFVNGKVIRSQVQTDRLSFLQQLGVLPIDLSNLPEKIQNPDAIHFIDKFSIPKTSIDEFVKQMNYNREFIKTLSGYKSGQAFEQYDNEGNLSIITIATWANKDKLDEAKTAVQTEFKRIGFNPTEFYQRLNIKMERGQYKFLKE